MGRRTVFNIGGNKYRLVARVNCRSHRFFILHIMLHADYSKGIGRFDISGGFADDAVMRHAQYRKGDGN